MPAGRLGTSKTISFKYEQEKPLSAVSGDEGFYDFKESILRALWFLYCCPAPIPFAPNNDSEAAEYNTEGDGSLSKQFLLEHS